MSHRLVIVGIGPAALSAAIQGASEGLDVTIIGLANELGGQIRSSALVENYPGTGPTSGFALAARMLGQAYGFGAHRVNGLATRVFPDDFVVRYEFAGGVHDIEYDALILAPGRNCVGLTCDGHSLPGVHVGHIAEDPGELPVVVGGANSAGQAALALATGGNQVALLCSSGLSKMSQYLADRIRNHPDITVFAARPVRIQGNDQAEVVDLDGGARITATSVTVYAGTRPNTDWLPSEWVGNDGSLITYPNHNLMRHGHDNIFAAGDARLDGISRVSWAVGDGAMAVHRAHQYFRR